MKIVVASTILSEGCYIVDMTTKDVIYDIPNLGCMLGMAYQAELCRLSKELAGSGLGITAAEYMIVRLLLAHGEMQQCEVSHILNKDRASISRSIKQLENKGLVVIKQLSYKCCLVSLSESGRALEPQILEIAEQLQQKLSERITPQQLNVLRETLKQIIK